jgi:hypothetical protein
MQKNSHPITQSTKRLQRAGCAVVPIADGSHHFLGGRICGEAMLPPVFRSCSDHAEARPRQRALTMSTLLTQNIPLPIFRSQERRFTLPHLVVLRANPDILA